jgi:CheY-like chemotaxis protein
VVLPTARNALRGAVPPVAPPVAGPARRKVLVVDDEAQIGSVLARILHAHDFTAVTRAAEALELLRASPYDLVLCDLMMPDMSGIDLYEAVQREVPAMAARFVFLTGGAFTARARAFLDTVPNARVEKPFDRNTILGLVGRA